MVAKVGILISGRGSNMVSLVEAMKAGRVEAEPVLVISNVADAAGLDRARDLGVKTAVASHKDHAGREDHDRAMVELLRAEGAGWVCLAGYMRLLSGAFLEAYPSRVMNIHPALLPSFPGLHAQKDAWEWGVTVSGVTVHLVDEELDHGPILAQRAVDISGAADADEVADRILAHEHQVYPEALALAVSGRWRLEGRRIVVD